MQQGSINQRKKMKQLFFSRTTITDRETHIGHFYVKCFQDFSKKFHGLVYWTTKTSAIGFCKTQYRFHHRMTIFGNSILYSIRRTILQPWISKSNVCKWTTALRPWISSTIISVVTTATFPRCERGTSLTWSKLVERFLTFAFNTSLRLLSVTNRSLSYFNNYRVSSGVFLKKKQMSILLLWMSVSMCHLFSAA